MKNTIEYGIPVTKQVGDIERLLRATNAMRTALDEFTATYHNSGKVLSNDECPDYIYKTLEHKVMTLIAIAIADYNKYD